MTFVDHLDNTQMELNYKVFGEGEPLIILHGLFGTLDNWQSIAKTLSKTYMVFIVDLRNHGRSPHSPDFSYEIMAEDVRAFMADNWIHQAYVMGHSMGGKVAMQLATHHEDMVQKLLVVDMAPKTYQPSHEAIFKALFSLDLEHLNSRRDADAHLATYLDSFAVRQFLIKNLYLDRTTGQYHWKMNLPVIYENYYDILQKTNLFAAYEGPTLFIKGANSNYIQEEELSDYQQCFPQAKLTTIPNAGHWIHAEQPQAFIEAVQHFLQQ